MVERPIKKSERQAAESDQALQENLQASEAPAKRSREDRGQSEGRDRRRDKDRKGKGNRSEQEVQQVNPALLRGPRPAKAKAAPVEAPAIEAEETAAAATEPVEAAETAEVES